MTLDAFKRSMALLAETFGRPLSALMLAGYEAGLLGLSDDQLSRATARALRESKFMPSPKELRDFVEAPIRITAAMQWAHVRRTVDKLDIYGSPDFGAVANAVIHALGGWKVLCEKSIPELVWYQKDFERLYAEFEAKDVSLLRTEGHVGELGNPPGWCALEGVPKPPKQLESSGRNGINPIIRELAEEETLETP